MAAYCLCKLSEKIASIRISMKNNKKNSPAALHNFSNPAVGWFTRHSGHWLVKKRRGGIRQYFFTTDKIIDGRVQEKPLVIKIKKKRKKKKAITLGADQCNPCIDPPQLSSIFIHENTTFIDNIREYRKLKPSEYTH